jgi:hypothetical protein
MYLKEINDIVTVYPYSVEKLLQDNPDTSFPINPSIELLNGWGVHIVVAVGQPAHNPSTQKIVETSPIFTGTRWQQSFAVVDLTVEEQEILRQENLPKKITKEQARLALNDLTDANGANMLDTVEALIPTLPRIARIKWEDGGILHIDNEFVNAMQYILGWTNQQKEDFFILASTK